MMTDGVTTQVSGLSGLACKADAQREFPNSRIGLNRLVAGGYS